MSSINHEENGCWHNLILLIILHQLCLSFHILQEVGAKLEDFIQDPLKF